MLLRYFSLALYVATAIFCEMGFHKLFSMEHERNIYVGGDAYNYIINTGFATAFFMFAGVLAISASTLYIVSYLKENAESAKENIVAKI